jgi:hypothetical protein
MSAAPSRPRRRAVGGLLAWPAWTGIGLATGATAGCAVSPPVPAPTGADPLPAPRVRPGDRWRYRATDRYNRGVIGEPIHEVLAAEPGPTLRIDPGDGRGEPVLERHADAWTVIAEATFDAPVVFERPMPIVPAGVRPGDTRRDVTRYASSRSSRPLRWEQWLRVRGWERVEVPAGAYDALCLERTVYFDHPDAFRRASMRIDRLWYAPSVQRWVRREWTGDFLWSGGAGRGGRAREAWVRWELIAYEPAAR